MANDVLRSAVQGISELITRPGLINVDFADVRTVMAEMGQAMMGSATSEGLTRAIDSARNALGSPLLEDINISGARGILVNVTAGPDLSIGEFGEIGNMIREIASDDAIVVIGTAIDPNMGESLRVTMVATGINNSSGGQSIRRPYDIVRNTAPMDRAAGGYDDLESEDMLIHTRKPASREELPPLSDAAGVESLDIPTFLRRQAD